jgi:hypothetical protein
MRLSSHARNRLVKPGCQTPMNPEPRWSARQASFLQRPPRNSPEGLKLDSPGAITAIGGTSGSVSEDQALYVRDDSQSTVVFQSNTTDGSMTGTVDSAQLEGDGKQCDGQHRASD